MNKHVTIGSSPGISWTSNSPIIVELGSSKRTIGPGIYEFLADSNIGSYVPGTSLGVFQIFLHEAWFGKNDAKIEIVVNGQAEIQFASKRDWKLYGVEIWGDICLTHHTIPNLVY